MTTVRRIQQKKGIKAAIIGAVATILAAVIGLIATLIKQATSPTNHNESGIQIVNPSVGGDQVIVGGDYYAPQPTNPQLHPDKPNLSYSKGEAYEEQQNYRKALAYYKQAAAEYEEIDGPASTDRAAALIAAGIMHRALAEYSEAIDCYLEAEAIYKNNPEKADMGRIYNSIAILYQDQGDYEKALTWFFRALEIDKDPAIYSNIAMTYGKQGDLLEALEWNYKAFSIAEEEFGKDDPRTAITYNNLGNIYFEIGEYDQSLDWFFKALVVFEKALGKWHSNTASLYNNIACVYDNQGNTDEALNWHVKALAIVEKEYGKEHPETATTYHNIAILYSAQGDYDRALEFHLKAYRIIINTFSQEHPSAKQNKENMEDTYKKSQRAKPFDDWLAEQLKR